MALELVSSEVGPSTAPPAVILTCRWTLAGVTSYSSALIDPSSLSDPRLWDDMQEQMMRWYSARIRKEGECCELAPACRVERPVPTEAHNAMADATAQADWIKKLTYQIERREVGVVVEQPQG